MKTPTPAVIRMGKHYDKALLLYDLARYAQAEAELRQGLAEAPDKAVSQKVVS
jgi:hypothetical protein